MLHTRQRIIPILSPQMCVYSYRYSRIFNMPMLPLPKKGWPSVTIEPTAGNPKPFHAASFVDRPNRDPAGSRRAGAKLALRLDPMKRNSFGAVLITRPKRSCIPSTARCYLYEPKTRFPVGRLFPFPGGNLTH
jgi:hypothetical protein